MKTKPFKHHSILWADDDTDDLYIVKEVMENIDDKHQVIEATDGRQALDYLNSIETPCKLPCLVVLDINMPVLNGKETLAIIRSEERFNSIAVVVFTTSSSERDRQFCERFGVEMFSKPHTYADFEKMIGTLLTLCRNRDDENPSLN
ncbi:MAG TPA: response regulator [Flavisolibacter sp.]|jgi:CheY-like chemotaxis protein